MESNNNQPSRVQQPLPKLPAWTVVATIFSYYGWLANIEDLLQKLSKASRTYMRSHHRTCLRNMAVKHQWHPFLTIPETIQRVDVKGSGYREWERWYLPEKVKAIVDGWNSEPDDFGNFGQQRVVTKVPKFEMNPDQVCQDIRGKIFGQHLTCKSTICVLLCPKNDLRNLRELENLACTYNEFVINDKLGCVIIFSQEMGLEYALKNRSYPLNGAAYTNLSVGRFIPSIGRMPIPNYRNQLPQSDSSLSEDDSELEDDSEDDTALMLEIAESNRLELDFDKQMDIALEESRTEARLDEETQVAMLHSLDACTVFYIFFNNFDFVMTTQQQDLDQAQVLIQRYQEVSLEYALAMLVSYDRELAMIEWSKLSAEKKELIKTLLIEDFGKMLASMI